MQSFKICFLLMIVSASAFADIKRISAIRKDLGGTQKIYLHAGMISVIEFPQNIIEVRLGNPKSIKAQLSQVSSKELTLYLSQQSVEPTNLIVRSEKRVYIFDIIPSKTSHQDYVKVVGAFGGPSIESSSNLVSHQVLGPKTSTKPPGRLIKEISIGTEQ